jgi:site-specific DNA recombinase
MKSLMQIALNRAGIKSMGAKEELKRIEKELNNIQTEKRELLRLLTRKVIDEKAYAEQFDEIDSEHRTLQQRRYELEQILLKEKDTEESLSAFKKEVQRFANLDIEDEETLRQVLHKLIEKVEVFADGSITIHYNFKNPMLKGA